MKKIVILTLVTLSLITLTACQNDDTYKIGASPVPHAEILEYVRPLLADQGYDFEVVVFTDYVLPNVALDNNDIIANYFQHIPYLEGQIDDHAYDFVSVGGVHIEPIGLYSKTYQSLDDLPNALDLIISNSPSDRPRLLGLLEAGGLIRLNDGVTHSDITASSLTNLTNLFTSDKTITFTEVDPAQLFSNYDNTSGDAVLINGNYALDHHLNPLEDALILEGSGSEYVNILVANQQDQNNAFILALIEVLQSSDVQQWIEDNYGGAVVPAA
ncbi:MAG: MetQ/NlpA family ABC transporter substrate-binding protein [Bacillota bacterium]